MKSTEKVDYYIKKIETYVFTFQRTMNFLLKYFVILQFYQTFLF